MQRFEIHSHTHYSNLRLLDCINRPKDLINRAIELGLSGIAITDHESLSGHMEINLYSKEIREKHPEFKIALGNEIYLCENRESGQKYYHFILIAKNATGHRALRELSSRAWMNSYFDRGMERAVTTYKDLYEIVQKYPNSLIASTACLGGELSTCVSNMLTCENVNDYEGRSEWYQRIIDFITFCKNLFDDDFYIECAPAQSRDQITVNKKLIDIANFFKVPMVIGSDAHYLKQLDRYVHKAYLNSKGGEREVDDFYEYSYLQSEEEVVENLQASYSDAEIKMMFYHSMNVYDKIENYSLEHKQTIPKVEVPDYPKKGYKQGTIITDNYPILDSLFNSDDKVERYWVNECVSKLLEKDLYNKTYLDRLEEEADIKKTISEKLGTNMFSYPVTLQHYVDLFWECGSIVGAGRGSSCSGLNHYLLGITQLDPIEWNLPFWRYLNKERVELEILTLTYVQVKDRLLLKKLKKKEERASKKKWMIYQGRIWGVLSSQHLEHKVRVQPFLPHVVDREVKNTQME